MRFLRIIDRELQKVNRHVTSTISNIETTLAQLNRQLAASALFEATVQLEHSTNLVANEIVELQRFIRINELALRKITKKFDKNHNEITSTWLCSPPPSPYRPSPPRTAACSCDAVAIRRRPGPDPDPRVTCAAARPRVTGALAWRRRSSPTFRSTLCL